MQPPLPILTRKSLDAVRDTIPAPLLRDLDQQLDAMFVSHFRPFLKPGEHGAGVSVRLVFDAAVARFHDDRLRLLAALLQNTPAKVVEALLDASASTMRELLDEAWRLGPPGVDFGEAVERYATYVDRLVTCVRNGSEPALDPEGLRALLLLGSRVDFAFTVVGLTLECEVEDPDSDRVSIACRAAREATTTIESLIVAAVGEGAGGDLEDLAGSWPDSEEDDLAVRELYDSRLPPDPAP